MKNIFRYVLLFLLGLPSALNAQTRTLDNLDIVGKGAGYQQADIKQTLAGIVQVVLGFIGWIFFIFILWSGIQWMTSGGNEKKVEDAKKRIVAATVGLVLVVLSYAIARSINMWLANAAGNSGTPGGGAGTP